MKLSLGTYVRDYSVAGGAVVYDTDAQAYFTANTAITSDADKNAINTFYLGLKSDGIYTKIKAMYLPIWGSASSCKWNLVNPLDTNPAFRLTFHGTSWAFSSSGMTPTNAYADTYLIQNNAFANNNQHFSIYIGTNVAEATTDLGVEEQYSGGNFGNMYLSPRWTANQLFASITANDTNRITSTNTDSRGMYVLSRTSSSSLKYYKNGTLQVTQTASGSSSRATFALILGAMRYKVVGGSILIGNYSTRQQRFSAIGTDLTDTESSNLSSRVNTLMTYFGINTY